MLLSFRPDWESRSARVGLRANGPFHEAAPPPVFMQQCRAVNQIAGMEMDLDEATIRATLKVMPPACFKTMKPLQDEPPAMWADQDLVEKVAQYNKL